VIIKKVLLLVKTERQSNFVLDWGSLATLSVRDPTVGFPFSNVFSLSDGATAKESSGVPYFFFTDMEMSVQDLNVSSSSIHTGCPVNI
jgi:hypothetical protein